MTKNEPLYQKHCVPCEGGVPAFAKPKNLEYLTDMAEAEIDLQRIGLK